MSFAPTGAYDYFMGSLYYILHIYNSKKLFPTGERQKYGFFEKNQKKIISQFAFQKNPLSLSPNF